MSFHLDPSEPNPSLLLAVGAFLMCLSHMRYASSFIAWIAPTPFCLYILGIQPLHKGEETSSLLSPFVFLAIALIAGWTLTTMKICTGHIPKIISVMYGIPLGGFQWCGYYLWQQMIFLLRDSAMYSNPDKSLELVAVYSVSFACSMTIQEYVQHQFTPFGTWGAACYTQCGTSESANLPLLQLCSIIGIAGPSFLMYWFAAIVSLGIQSALSPSQLGPVITNESTLKILLVWFIVMAIIHYWGSLRLDVAASSPVKGESSSSSTSDMVKVASVITDATFSGLPLPAKEQIEKINDKMFRLVDEAANGGAQLISWTEGATVALPGEEEEKLLKRAQDLVKRHNNRIHLVLCYIVPIKSEPSLLYENKSVWILPDGKIHHQYLKCRPVPGEPAVPGKYGNKPAAVVHGNGTTEGFTGSAATAICYDFDFPKVGLRYARAQVDLVVLPSSDWRGIDPLHTYMAAIRAIEGGYSILRTTRMGLTAAIDPYGIFYGRLSWNQLPTSRLMIASLPLRRKTTIYSIIGDTFIYLCIGFLAFFAASVKALWI